MRLKLTIDNTYVGLILRYAPTATMDNFVDSWFLHNWTFPPTSTPSCVFPDEVAGADVDLLEGLPGEGPHLVLQAGPLGHGRRRLRHRQEAQRRVGPTGASGAGRRIAPATASNAAWRWFVLS